MSHLVGLVCPNATSLERVRALAPPVIRVEWVDSNGHIDAQAEVMQDAVAALVSDGRFDVELARLCPRLKLVQTTSAGYDAILDVFEEEPTPRDNPLLTMGNVVVTPHMAGVSVEAFPRNAGFGLENIARVIRGEEALSVVRPV